MEKTRVRINKFLSEAGVCSRREADRHVEAGNVRIDDHLARMGEYVWPEQKVYFKDEEVVREAENNILLALYKPVGIVCTTEKRVKNNVIKFMDYPKRVFPVGRLDKDSEGLLLLTNNGDIVNKIMRAGNKHEKEYVVTVHKPITDSFLRGMAAGVPLPELDTVTRPCKVKRLGECQFKIVVTQGLNRQIRRMCEYFGYIVIRLVRMRIINIKLGSLRPGEYREVTEEEYQELLELTKNSYSAPIMRERDWFGTRGKNE